MDRVRHIFRGILLFACFLVFAVTAIRLSTPNEVFAALGVCRLANEGAIACDAGKMYYCDGASWQVTSNCACGSCATTTTCSTSCFICTPNATTCTSGVVRVCNSTGTAYSSTTTCACGTCANSTTCGSCCLPTKCPNGCISTSTSGGTCVTCTDPSYCSYEPIDGVYICAGSGTCKSPAVCGKDCPPSCGAFGFTCCSDTPKCYSPGECDYTNTCVPECGGLLDRCCIGGTCDSPYTCSGTNYCIAYVPACADVGQACTGVKPCCSSSNACSDGICKTCGGLGQPCCTSGTACTSPNLCNTNNSTCEALTQCAWNLGCGTTGPLCPSNYCPSTEACVQTYNNCKPWVNCKDYTDVIDLCDPYNKSCIEPILGNCSDSCWPDWCVEQCGLSGCASNGYCGSYDSCNVTSPQTYVCNFCDGSTIDSTPAPTAIAGNTATPTNTSWPTPSPGLATINIRARSTPNSSTGCADVDNASIDWLPVTLNLRDATSALSPTNQSAADGVYAMWNVATPAFYSLPLPSAPAGYSLVYGCVSNNNVGTEGITASIAGETINYELWYKTGMAWYQTQGGEVYGAGNVTSFVPSSATNRYFVTNGLGGFPGVVTWGNAYDFDSAAGTTNVGSTWISPTNWNANETYDQTNFYEIMYHRFESPSVPDFTGTLDAKPTSAPGNGEAYYADGDLVVNGPAWTVGVGESYVIFVNGNLTIQNRITITTGGFVALIVNGDITIDPSVGTTAASSTPVVEGIYMTSPGHTFYTGASTDLLTPRFVGRGTFVAGDFSFQRDLEISSANPTTPAELFVYNPELLVYMPDAMKDLPITWAEVAP